MSDLDAPPISPDVLSPGSSTPEEPPRPDLSTLPEGPYPSPARFDGIEEKRLLNETGMLHRPGLFWRLFMWFAFRKVKLDERFEETVRALHEDGDVSYVMPHHSLLDYLFFNYRLAKHKLPLAFVANAVTTMLFVRPLWGILLHGLRRLFGYYKHRLEPRERFAYALNRGHTTLLALRKGKLWADSQRDVGEPYLETMLKAQLERIENTPEGERVRPIYLLPQILVWVHDPNRKTKTFWHQVFGTTNAPSKFRKITNFLINRNRTLVRYSDPIDLRAFLLKHQGEKDLSQLAKTLHHDIFSSLEVEERLVKGPELKTGPEIQQEILESETVQEAINKLAEELNEPPEKVNAQVKSYLKEMGADFSMFTIEMICIVLTLVFNRIFHEMVVDQPGLERVRTAARKTPLILLPCHRSHIDYLVLSYVFYLNGLIPPHITAGKNLNFFPIGYVFRRAGAFFIRRSFKDNKPYSLAFREYLQKILGEGYWVEFFIEGGRSRTGKMLSPKFGVLKVIVDAIRNGSLPDVHFVPVYVGYEQVIEEKSFSRELGGAEKKKENLGALLSATKVLWAKYGRLYINFGEPISCQEALSQFDTTVQKRALIENKAPPTDLDNLFLSRLGFRICDAINRVAMVTPSALVAAALLFHDKRGLSAESLTARVGLLLEYCLLKKAYLSKTIEDGLKRHRDRIVQARHMLESAGLYEQRFALGESSPLARARGMAIREAIDESINRLEKTKQITTHRFDDDVVYAPIPAERINLDFYKNNIVHLFVSDAVLAAAIRATLQDGVTNVARVMEAAAFLSRTFQYEFIFDPEKGFAAQFNETLLRFDEGGLIVRVPGEDFSQVEIRIAESGKETLHLLHRILMPWIEAYWLIAEALEFNVEESVLEADFIKLAQSLGRSRYQVGDITCPEAASKVNFEHALSAWEEFGLIERVRKGREKHLIPVRPAEDPHRFQDLRSRLRTYFA